MKASVIISYFNAPDNLHLILQALNNQSIKDFEVIISEDDNNPETDKFVQQARNYFSFPIKHLHLKEKQGFTKNIMLNASVLSSQSENLIFIDGDCIPHRHFVRAYLKNFEDNKILIGRAVMLSSSFSDELKKKNSIKKLNFLSILFSASKRKKDGLYLPFSLQIRTKGLVGRNWGIRKKHLLEVNGFDNDYTFAGVGEDVDIEWRLLSNGLERKSMKNKAIVYHLYHPKIYSEQKVAENYNLLASKQKTGNIKCLNGLNNIVINDNTVELKNLS